VHVDEPFPLQNVQSFTDRLHAYTEAVGYGLLTNPLARREFAFDDHESQLIRDALRDRNGLFVPA
jgi:hypothetical protein